MPTHNPNTQHNTTHNTHNTKAQTSPSQLRVRVQDSIHDTEQHSAGVNQRLSITSPPPFAHTCPTTHALAVVRTRCSSNNKPQTRRRRCPAKDIRAESSLITSHREQDPALGCLRCAEERTGTLAPPHETPQKRTSAHRACDSHRTLSGHGSTKHFLHIRMGYLLTRRRNAGEAGCSPGVRARRK